MNNRVLIAMSGGVDSSVAAYLMKSKGFDCVGVTMKLFDKNEDENTAFSNKSCCSLDDIEDARGVAFSLGFPYYVFNFKEDFEKNVINRFICAYEQGITPNPCIDCNRYLKFEALYKRAEELSCDHIVTGHYARIEEKNGRYLLKKALDPNKDQSYVLYSLTQEQLSHTYFPLGEMTKAQTRKIAEENGFSSANKPDSQDICFVPDGDYASFIENRTGNSYTEGDFTDKDGKILGKHKGIIHYTLGQRKGLGISFGEPLYVTEIIPKENRVVLGKNDELFTKELDAKNINIISFDTPPATFRAYAKVRYKQTEQPATVIMTGDKTAHIVFDEAQRAITKGQAVVFYDGDTVIGGGVIC